jgi:hypothetical protein
MTNNRAAIAVLLTFLITTVIGVLIALVLAGWLSFSLSGVLFAITCLTVIYPRWRRRQVSSPGV